MKAQAETSALRGLLDHRGRKVRRARQVRLGRKDSRAMRARRETSVHPEVLGLSVRQALRDLREHRALWARRGQTGMMELMELPVRRGPLDLQARQGPAG